MSALYTPTAKAVEKTAAQAEMQTLENSRLAELKELIGFIAKEQETKERQALIESRIKALNKAGAEAHQRTEGPTNGLLSQAIVTRRIF